MAAISQTGVVVTVELGKRSGRQSTRIRTK